MTLRGEHVPRCHLVYQKSNAKWPWIESDLPQREPGD